MTARRIILLLLYAGLIAGGIALGHAMPAISHALEGNHSMVAVAAAVYVVATALPFVPGAEIGMALMAMLGAAAALLVYGCTVAALTISFLAGWFVPPRLLARGLAAIGLARAAAMVGRVADLSPAEQRAALLGQLSARLPAPLVRYRYLALALLFNLPGNTLLGGGGGIAMMAGMSRLFSPPAYLATVFLAVAPVPFLVMAVGYQP